MPISPTNLFAIADCRHTGTVPWGQRVVSEHAGVYVVSLSSDPNCATIGAPCCVSKERVAAWLMRVPTFQMDGRAQPEAEAVATRIASWWLPEETILYIGKAEDLGRRIGQYYRTPLGDRSPHRGGHWLKTLDELDNLWIHYAEVAMAPETYEATMLHAFIGQAAGAAPSNHPERNLALPFANLVGAGGRRAHGLRNTTL